MAAPMDVISSKIAERQLVRGLHDAIVDCDSNRVLQLLSDDGPLVRESGWTILTSLCESLPEAGLETKAEETLQAALDGLLQEGNPREMLFSLLEACQGFKSGSLFSLLVPRVAQTALRLPLRQLSLDVILDTVSSHIRMVTWPDGYGLTETAEGGVSGLATDGDAGELVAGVRQVVVGLAEPLWQGFSSQCSSAHKQMFVDWLLRLLDFPLLYLFASDSPSVTECCCTLLGLLQTIVPTLSSLVERAADRPFTAFTADRVLQDPARHASQQASPGSGLSHACCLVLCGDASANYFPCVYSSVHRLTLLLRCLNDLYDKAGSAVVVYKTQRLIGCLLDGLEEESLDERLLELPGARSLVPYAYWCMQYCDLEPLRKTGSKQLSLFIQKLTPGSRYLLFNWILETEVNPDVLGHSYTQIKDLIHSTWQDGRQSEGELGRRAVRLVGKIFQPPDPESAGLPGDLIADLGKIASALNLALYLVLKDRKRSSLYTEHMSRYVREYVQPVGACLQAQLQRLRAQLDDLCAEDRSAVSDVSCSVSVGNETLTSPSHLHRESLQAAMAKLELVLFNNSALKEALER